MFEKIIGMNFKPPLIMTQFVITRIVDYLQVQKNKLLLPAEYYDKILVITQNYSHIGLLGKLENNYVIVNYENINKIENKYLDCKIIDNVDYQYLTTQLILNVLTNYDISTYEVEPFNFDNEFVIITKIIEDIDKQLHCFIADSLTLQLNFTLNYNVHFTEKGFLLRENLNYLKDYKNIDFTYDFDMVINPVIGISLWNYNIFVNFSNFVRLFEELYTLALTLKNLN